MSERVYTIPLRDAYEKPRTKRAKVAVKIIRQFAARHMKSSIDNVIISNYLNAIVWKRGIQKPPRKVKVKMKKDGDIVYVYALDEKEIQKKENKGRKSEKKDNKMEEKEEKKSDGKIKGDSEYKSKEDKSKDEVERKNEGK